MTKLRAILKRRWPILLACLIFGFAAGVLSSEIAGPNKVKLYIAKHTIFANPNSTARLNPAQDALKVKVGEVPAAVKKRLKSDLSAEQLAASINSLYSARTNSITIDSNDEDPDEAARRVDAFAAEFLRLTNERLQSGERRQLDKVIEQLDAAKAELVKFDAEHPDLLIQGSGRIASEPATLVLLSTRSAIKANIDAQEAVKARREVDILSNLPYESVGSVKPVPWEGNLIDVPSTKLARGGLIGMLGLLLAGTLVMIIERVGKRIDTREELVDITDLPILAEIGFVPQKRRAVDDAGKVSLTGIWAEPYRRVRSAIQFVQANGAKEGSWHPQPGSPSQLLGTPPSVFLVTSTSPAEGKSTTSALVALALAEVGVPTVLVGGDFRKPQVDRLVGAGSGPSLRDLATLSMDRPDIDEVVQPTEHEHLYVAAAGTATREVAGLVDAAKAVCSEAVARGATVIIDSSPLQAANDTLDLLPVVDYVVLVLRVGKSSETDLLDTIETLKRMESNLLGIVLVGTPAARKQEYYYDYYSHGPSVGGSAVNEVPAAPVTPPPVPVGGSAPAGR